MDQFPPVRVMWGHVCYATMKVSGDTQMKTILMDLTSVLLPISRGSMAEYNRCRFGLMKRIVTFTGPYPDQNPANRVQYLHVSYGHIVDLFFLVRSPPFICENVAVIC